MDYASTAHFRKGDETLDGTYAQILVLLLIQGPAVAVKALPQFGFGCVHETVLRVKK